MMRSLMLVGALPAASAVHLSGPMNDAMVQCGAANCPDFMALMAPDADIAGTGLPLSGFLAPPLNAVPFIYDMEYALNVMGYTKGGARTVGSFNYRNTPNSAENPVPQDLTATSTEDASAIFGCMCEKCGAMVEAIFQPVGRMVCSEVGFPLPCQTEFEACQQATSRPTGYTGTAADMNIVYPPVSPPRDADGNWASSTDVCQPEAAFGAYKAAYDLTTQCAAGDTEMSGSAEALTLAKCVAASRNDVYWANGVAPADSDIGGFTCGLDYGAAPGFPCTTTDAASYDFDANTMGDAASDTCKACITDKGNLAPCIGAPECVAHQFTPSMYVDHMSGGGSVINMICTGLRTSLCDALSMSIIDGKKAFFANNPNCPAPSPPPSFGCSFDTPATCTETAATSVADDATACAAVTDLDDATACEAVMTVADGTVAACTYVAATTDVAAWQAGSPYTGASASCSTCLNDNEAVADKQSTCWGPPACARPAFAGMALSMPPSDDVKNMICFGVGIPDGRPGGWGEDTTDCDAGALAVIDSKKSFFQCPASGLAVNFPCTFDADVPVYARAKAGTGFATSMMAMPNLACYQCIVANNNNIAPCIGPPECVAPTFTTEIMTGPMAGIVDTICTGLCTSSCSETDILVIEEKQALMDGGCTARGTPVASTCPTCPTDFDCSAETNSIAADPASITCTDATCTAAECCTVEPPAATTCPTDFDCSAETNSIAADPASITCTDATCTAAECCTVAPTPTSPATPPPASSATTLLYTSSLLALIAAKTVL